MFRVMASAFPFAEFREFVTESAPLAPLTGFRLGGPAAALARPRGPEELLAVWRRAREEGIAPRVLSGGSNVLVREPGVGGLVVHLESPAFSDVSTTAAGELEAGAAVPLTALCSQAARGGLAGLETLAGIPGTVGGALADNAGTRHHTIRKLLRSVTVLTPAGELTTLEPDALSDRPGPGGAFADSVIVSATFALNAEDSETIVRRMRRAWIVRREHQPYGHQSAGYVFRDPSPDRAAAAVIEAAGLRGTRAGTVEISDRNANFLIAHPGANSDDVLRLIEHVRDKVAKELRIELDLHLHVW